MPLFFRLTVKSSNLQRKNTFLKSNRQYLKNQQTFLIAPDSPCQTVLNFFGFLFTPAQFKSIWNEPLSEYMYFNLCSIIAPLTKIRQGDIWHGSRPSRQGECCTPEISRLTSFTSFEYIGLSNLKSGTHDVLIGQSFVALQKTFLDLGQKRNISK